MDRAKAKERSMISQTGKKRGFSLFSVDLVQLIDPTILYITSYFKNTLRLS
jgi:hypothetical protein